MHLRDRMKSRSFLELAGRLESEARRLPFYLVGRIHDLFASSHISSDRVPAGALRPIGVCPSRSGLSARAELIRRLAYLYMDHRFDLLGSGWVRVYRGMTCAGFRPLLLRTTDGRLVADDLPPELDPRAVVYPPGRGVTPDADGEWLRDILDPRNVAYSRSVWRLVDRGYEPIDWQLDFKSGYRFDESRPSRSALAVRRPGVDIKVPWELARLQHLPILAMAAQLESGGSNSHMSEYTREIKNQILDFVATNPPRFGVNWACPMDVAIRVCNMIIAWSMLDSLGLRDDGFDRVHRQTVYEHGRFIRRNLERSRYFRNNHYLADLVGLIFAGAHLPPTRETDSWLALGASELFRAVEEQFNEDGSNFESSVPYHRLSAELVLWGTAVSSLAEASGRIDFRPESWYLERLERMAEFSRDMTKPDGRVVQIGDNDNGRLFKLASAYDDGVDGPIEDHLDHAETVSLFGVLTGRDDLAGFGGGAGPAREILESVMGGRGPMSETSSLRPGRRSAQRAEIDVVTLPQDALLTEFRASAALTDGLELIAYEDFGIYVWRSERLWLGFRCGGSKGPRGHAHDDALTVELVIDGESVATDPGSFVYTPDPVGRNYYRSAAAHFRPVSALPEHLDSDDVFRPIEGVGEVLEVGARSITGRIVNPRGELFRKVVIEPERVAIWDWPRASLYVLPAPTFSPGYGRLSP